METAKHELQRAVIFGASGGIGRALARALDEADIEVWAGSRGGGTTDGRLNHFTFDLQDEASIAAIAERLRGTPPDLVIVSTGVLTLDGSAGPERSFRHIETTAMAKAFEINSIGPALVAKYMLPILLRDRRSVFAALSARVGSIADNRLGGWYSYRASKAALNMLLKSFAIELGRTHKHAVVAGLHPGTVDTDLSLPFQSNLPAGQLATPEAAARDLLRVVHRLSPEDSGGVFDWKGEPIPF